MAKKLTAKEELTNKAVELEGLATEARMQVGRYVEDGVKSAGTKARNALRDMRVLAQLMRKLVLEIRNESKA
jgi:hypothetical protein